MSKCEICEALKDHITYCKSGGWVDLVIREDNDEKGKVKIMGICDGKVEIEANYCPICRYKI